jgi:hypothetical protein
MSAPACPAERVGVFIETHAIEPALVEHFQQYGQGDLDMIMVMADRQGSVELRGSGQQFAHDGAKRWQVLELFSRLWRVENVVLAAQGRFTPYPFGEIEPAIAGSQHAERTLILISAG